MPVGHEIIDRLEKVDKNSYLYFEKFAGEAPTDPDEFLEWMWEKQSKCTNCFLSDTRNNVVKWDGTASADVMVVLESPGFNEDLTKIPLTGIMEVRASECSSCLNVSECFKTRFLRRSTDFWGKGKREHVVCKPDIDPNSDELPDGIFMRTTGTIVDSVILNLFKFKFPRNCWRRKYKETNDEDLPESPWFFTNVVACRSYNKNSLKDEPPAGSAVKACSPWLAGQWAAVQPKIIVVLGVSAMKRFMTVKKTPEINSVTRTKYGPVIYNNHPSHMMREVESELKAHLFARLGLTFKLALIYAGKLNDRYWNNWKERQR